MTQQEITVIFDMWGQRCQTTFDATSELAPLTWLERCHSKGWLRPVEVVMANGVVLYDQKELLAFEWDS